MLISFSKDVNAKTQLNVRVFDRLSVAVISEYLNNRKEYIFNRKRISVNH